MCHSADRAGGRRRRGGCRWLLTLWGFHISVGMNRYRPQSPHAIPVRCTRGALVTPAMAMALPIMSGRPGHGCPMASRQHACINGMPSSTCPRIGVSFITAVEGHYLPPSSSSSGHSLATTPLALLLQRRQGVQQSGLQVERSLRGFPAIDGHRCNTKLGGELGDRQSLLAAQSGDRFAGRAHLGRGASGSLGRRVPRGDCRLWRWLPAAPFAGRLRGAARRYRGWGDVAARRGVRWLPGCGGCDTPSDQWC